VDDREVYPNAPVVLVALEVRHPTAGPLTSAQRLKIKQRLGKQLPILKSGQLTMLQATVGATTVPEMSTEEFPKYFSRDNTIAVSIRSEAIVIETTRYVRWEHLRELTGKVLEARQEIDGVERVGLRYIDEIRIPDDTGEGWAPWVDSTLLGPAPVGEPLGLRATQWHGITVFESGPDRAVALRYGPRDGYAVDPGGDLKRPAPGTFFLMDIDSFWTPSDGVPELDIEMLLTTCDELHAPVRSLFERLITDRLRKEVLRHAK
jgi:uncharacterized protein (TIGR04255 family)